MPYTADPSFAEFVRHLPKTETHLHIEGACPYELLKVIDPVKHANPPPLWDENYRYKDGLNSFMPLYIEYCQDFFTSAERYHQAAEIMLKACAAQGCRYVETSFHLPHGPLHEGHGRGRHPRHQGGGGPGGSEVRVFAGMCHNDYAGAGKELIEDSLLWPRSSTDSTFTGWRTFPSNLGPRTSGPAPGRRENSRRPMPGNSWVPNTSNAF